MPSTHVVPAGVVLSTVEQTIYSTPLDTNTMLIVRFMALSVTATINVWMYSGSGPGTDAKRLVAANMQIAAGQTFELSPLYPSAGFKVTASCSGNGLVTANAQGIETSTVG